MKDVNNQQQMKEEVEKITINLPKSAVKELDEYMKKGLFGSRGRAIQGLLRDVKELKTKTVELFDKAIKLMEQQQEREAGLK